ncbi:MAG: hypothetical protein WCQ95_11115 [Bacteroidota bacterium]
MRNSIQVFLAIACIGIASYFSASQQTKIKPNVRWGDTWENQLNSLNYLVMRSSSINLINGLNLTPEQIVGLQKLALQVDALHLQMPDYRVSSTSDFAQISTTFGLLIQKLLNKTMLTDTVKNQVNRIRESEVDLIKRSILAANQPGYTGEGCQQCHGEPRLFAKGSILAQDTPPISANDRKEIDLAHVKGLFGDEGTLLLWELKSAVDSLLTNEQRYVFGSFRCCLIPPEDVADPGIIGQSFVTNQWIEYFKEIRALGDADWLKYEDLYLIPLRDLVEAKLPGIKKKDKDAMIRKAEEVIDRARKMDKVDFQLQKENLCVELGTALNIDLLNGEASRTPDERKFMAAMFLLFPGSSEIYMQMGK